MRISKYKNIIAKGYTPNWSAEVFVIKEIKNRVLWTYVINDLNGEEITGTFYEKELQKIDQQEFRIEKVIRKKGDLKNILHVDVSSFALKSNLASLKTEVDKLDIDKLVSVPVDLSKL